MKKKSIYMPPVVETYIADFENLCGVKMSEAKGKTGYEDISDIGGNDDEYVAPTSNNIWFDGDDAGAGMGSH